MKQVLLYINYLSGALLSDASNDDAWKLHNFPIGQDIPQMQCLRDIALVRKFYFIVKPACEMVDQPPRAGRILTSSH